MVNKSDLPDLSQGVARSATLPTVGDALPCPGTAPRPRTRDQNRLGGSLTPGFPGGTVTAQPSPPGKLVQPSKQACEGAVGDSSALGLVYTVTSDTSVPAPSPPELLTLSTDNTKSRLRKMRTGVITTANYMQNYLTDHGFRFRAAMVTLTYAPGQEYHPRDVSTFLKHIRQWAKRRKVILRGLWVLELTKAGNPHYHVLLWLPRGFTIPKPDKQGWWRKGSTRIEWARKPVGYMAKYASKGTNDPLPVNARLWGAVGRPASVIAACTWWMAPAWLKGFTEPGTLVRKVAGWWHDYSTGIEYRSPWVIDSFALGSVVLRWVGWTPDDIRFT